MTAYLVRVGIDQAFGEWNAPVDPITGEFVYVPIPEGATTFHPQCQRRFAEVLPALQQFCRPRQIDLATFLHFNRELLDRSMHLDPDFDYLTYGDDGARRGAGIAALHANDFLVFYAGLRPVSACGHRLLYALIGLYVVDEVLPVPAISPDRWPENAHTRKIVHAPRDVVVRARPGVSGRLERCLPIGLWRAGAYRVQEELLEAWGGLSVKDGFIQRSAVPPRFLQPERFLAWFQDQNVGLMRRNN